MEFRKVLCDLAGTAAVCRCVPRRCRSLLGNATTRCGASNDCRGERAKWSAGVAVQGWIVTSYLITSLIDTLFSLGSAVDTAACLFGRTANALSCSIAPCTSAKQKISVAQRTAFSAGIIVSEEETWPYFSHVILATNCFLA
jgi:hypothetical protein